MLCNFEKKKQFWEENFILFYFIYLFIYLFVFLIDFSKKKNIYIGRPFTLGSVGGVQPNNFFLGL